MTTTPKGMVRMDDEEFGLKANTPVRRVPVPPAPEKPANCRPASELPAVAATMFDCVLARRNPGMLAHRKDLTPEHHYYLAQESEGFDLQSQAVRTIGQTVHPTELQESVFSVPLFPTVSFGGY